MNKDWTKIAHAPQFDIQPRGRFTKYYQCKRCGETVMATSKHEARIFHDHTVALKLKSNAEAAIAALADEKEGRGER